MWHSCGKFSLEDLFAKSEPQVEEFFRKFARMVRSCGEVRMIPQKSRVVFQARMRFAGCMPRKSYLICHLVLPWKMKSARFYRIETFTPRCHAHCFRVTSEEDLDDEVAAWLKEAYQVGQQKFLKAKK
jgi:hypothetical protein